MEIHVVDMSDSDTGSADFESLKKQGKTHIIQMYGMSNGITQMITKIIDVAGNYYTIDKLAIWAHGSPGGQSISGGQSGYSAHWAGITVSNIGASVETISRLLHYFKPNAVAELRGCNVAGEKAGMMLLTILAQQWNVRVRAGIFTQYPNHGWLGTVHEARPGMEGVSIYQGEESIIGQPQPSSPLPK